MTIHSPLLRILRVAIGLLLIGFAVRSLIGTTSTQDVGEILRNSSLRWMILGGLAMALTYPGIMISWRSAMSDQGDTLKPLQAARVVFLSNLGKYAPGRGWGIVGAGVLAREYGLSSWNAVSVTLVMQVLTLATGMIVAGTFASSELSRFGRWVSPLLTFIGVLVLAASASLSISSVRKRIDGMLPRLSSRIPKITWSTWLIVVVLSTFIWFGLGLSLMLVERALLGAFVMSSATAIGVSTASYLLGFIALLAPAGIGPREAAFVILLSSTATPVHAATLALLSRILVTICDLMFAGPFLKRGFGGPDSKQPNQSPMLQESRS